MCNLRRPVETLGDEAQVRVAVPSPKVSESRTPAQPGEKAFEGVGVVGRERTTDYSVLNVASKDIQTHERYSTQLRTQPQLRSLKEGVVSYIL